MSCFSTTAHLYTKPWSIQSFLNNTRRLFHSAKAELTTVDAAGTPMNRTIKIFIGDPGEAYIIFDKDTGFHIRREISKQVGMPRSFDAARFPLVFNHDTNSFTNDALPFPRITINQEMPRQTLSCRSPATLWLWGATHSITLNGSADEQFVHSSWESHRRLQGAASLLRDTMLSKLLLACAE